MAGLRDPAAGKSGAGLPAAAIGGAVAALALIAVGIFLLLSPQEPAAPPAPPPLPSAEEIWSDARAAEWFKEARDDAELYMTLDGSAASVRQFMVERKYTMGNAPAEVSEDELQYFYRVDSEDLKWMVENQPEFDAWSARMRGHLSGRRRAELKAAMPRPSPTASVPKFSVVGLICLVAGVAVGIWAARTAARKRR